jgi:hypothetical protein
LALSGNFRLHIATSKLAIFFSNFKTTEEKMLIYTLSRYIINCGLKYKKNMTFNQLNT